jgi:hypothetical protein
MRATGKRLLAMALCALTACATTSAANELPAIIVSSDGQSGMELQNAVAKALDRSSVALADDALTRTSTLTIEPARMRDPQGSMAQGREMRMPESFRLVKSGHACILIHERTGQRIELPNTKCAAKR